MVLEQTSAIYTVYTFGAPDDSRADEMRRTLAAQLESMGLHRSVQVIQTEFERPAKAPNVGVYLCSPEANQDASLAEKVSQFMADGGVIFPIVRNLATFHDEAPEHLAALNGFEWSDHSGLEILVGLILRELGIEEKQRRVFISHRRSDGSGAAQQLFDELSHRRFIPFIDRFAIPFGADVQRAIADALEDHAFLLVLETPDAHASEWVLDEVDYALSHYMGLLIVTWPAVTNSIPGTEGLPRIQLRCDDTYVDEHGYYSFDEAALDNLISQIETAHAVGMARRRRYILRSIEEAARASGATRTTPLPSWRLLVETTSEQYMVGTTPRLPCAFDLEDLDGAARGHGDGNAERLLVHSARALTDRLRAHLEWVTATRAISIVPENGIGGWWR